MSAAAFATSCGSDKSDDPEPPKLASKEQLLDSKFCGACHRDHYQEWAASMHAYATDDPVFRALNAKMQNDVSPEQKTFCLNCHAPMAVRLGKADDIAALDKTPELKGVTCFFCHAVNDVRGTHDNPLILDESDAPGMGGAIHDPVDPKVHKAEYRTWLDGTQENQSGMCGPCHDIIAVAGAHIERTFKEWSQSKFGVGSETKTSCASCHMKARDGVASVTDGAPQRRIHDHSMVGVDLALTAFPDKDVQRAKIQEFLSDAIDAKLCVDAQSGQIDVGLHNEKVGHAWPSGSNQDRRAWVELTAYAGGNVVFQSGHVPDNVAVTRFDEKSLFILRDVDFDAQGKETKLFWRSAKFVANQLPPRTSDPREDNTVHVKYTAPTPPDRVTMVLKIRAMDADFFDELTPDLDEKSLDPVTTFALDKSQREWTPDKGPCVGQ